MTPDKIYLAWEYSEIDTLPPGVTSKKVFGKDVEYIRKDALLEWLERQNVDKKLIQPLIDKINSL